MGYNNNYIMNPIQHRNNSGMHQVAMQDSYTNKIVVLNQGRNSYMGQQNQHHSNGYQKAQGGYPQQS